MTFLYYSLIFILVYTLILTLIIGLLILVTYIISKENPNLDKLSAYECGYEAFNDTQQQQDIRFFIIGLLFIIFDIDLMILFPWSISLTHSSSFVFWVGVDFLIELGLSFLVVWLLYIFDWK